MCDIGTLEPMTCDIAIADNGVGGCQRQDPYTIAMWYANVIEPMPYDDIGDIGDQQLVILAIGNPCDKDQWASDMQLRYVDRT